MPSPSSISCSLSKYYPKGTIYFYGFPAGENSSFFNQVTPWKEELVAARPLTCAGEHVKAIAFNTSLDNDIWKIMTEELGIQLINKNQVIALPDKITETVEGSKRNFAIKKAIREKISNKKLVMAQPYLQSEINEQYLIDSKLAIGMNDKSNIKLYIDAKHFPERYQIYTNGKKFEESKIIPPLPCVVKVASSSSGDGVRICNTKEQFRKAQKDFSALKVKIFTEKFITSIFNLGIQFGIQANNGAIDIIGHNEQLVDGNGSYLGGVVNSYKKYPSIEKIYKLLQEEILPRVQKMGWFGVGGLDVLIDEKEDLFFIDPNFRMTAATSYLLMHKNGLIKYPTISFMGEFKGSQEELIRKICPLGKENSRNQMMKVIAITKRKESFGINAGIFFENISELKKNALHLQKLGITAGTLDRIVTSKYLHLE
ncbi:MAG: ATP-grasp domain-containing protein [Candidatus Gracilibacteria bacterium]|jgi:hypothetical protein